MKRQMDETEVELWDAAGDFGPIGVLVTALLVGVRRVFRWFR